MSDNYCVSGYPDDLVLPFLFIPHGEPEGPEVAEFKARYPEWFSIPGWFIPRPESDPESVEAAPMADLSPELSDQSGHAESGAGWSATSHGFLASPVAPKESQRSIQDRPMQPPPRPGSAIEMDRVRWRIWRAAWAAVSDPVAVLRVSSLTRGWVIPREGRSDACITPDNSGAVPAICTKIQRAASYFDLFGMPTFGFHAMERMNQSGISPTQLDGALIASPTPGISPGTMNFVGGGFTAVVNEDGLIVTVY